MENINTYIKYGGSKKMEKESNFNEVDGAIMARLSYLRFDKIDISKSQTLEEASAQMKDIPNEEFLYNGDKELIYNLGKSARFKNLIVSDYIKINDKDAEKQFGAITIHLSDEEMYVSFIGTDSTLYGWKEDFNMSFMDNVPCQVSGKEYLENIAKKYPRKKIRVGGHSKGGNVAIYSVLTASQDIKNRVIQVYNYDGPGFSKNFINKYETQDIINKIKTFIPQDSIIGRILYHKEEINIVLSSEKGIYQHDIYSWQIEDGKMTRVEKNTEKSEEINKILIALLENTTPENRKVFVDAVFELFFSIEVDTLSELKSELPTSIPKMVQASKEISKEDKKTIIDLLRIFAKIYFGVTKERESTKLENAKELVSSKYSELIKEVDLKIEKMKLKIGEYNESKKSN